jgi:hypothetical protein
MWLSSEIFYKRVPIYKKTLFGKRKKLGFELSKPLRWKVRDGLFYVLPTGYIWDGPSYMKWMEWVVGRRNSNAALAASAFHDVHSKIPARYSDKNEMHHIFFNIRDGAELYQRMLDAWPDDRERLKPWQAKIQRVGLVIFQPIYKLLNSETDWLHDK